MPLHPLPPPIAPRLPLTALAPMQDVTDLRFMSVIAHYGSPDYFFTEYFRVYARSGLHRNILRSITENATGRPVFAQLIGESIADLVRVAGELSQYPIAGIDLNLGCPAPRIYRKNVGGGLLRDPDTIDRMLGALREAIDGRFTVKMRLGFDDTANFDRILDHIDRHAIDLLSLHGRTVKELYHSDVHYDFIAHAVQRVACPVLANGNVTSAFTAATVLSQTNAAGVMIGRAAIRNPWIFQQTRQHLSGQTVSSILLPAVREYIERLRLATAMPYPTRTIARQPHENVPQLHRSGRRCNGCLPQRHAPCSHRGGTVWRVRSALAERTRSPLCGGTVPRAGSSPQSGTPHGLIRNRVS